MGTIQRFFHSVRNLSFIIGRNAEFLHSFQFLFVFFFNIVHSLLFIILTKGNFTETKMFENCLVAYLVFKFSVSVNVSSVNFVQLNLVTLFFSS